MEETKIILPTRDDRPPAPEVQPYAPDSHEVVLVHNDYKVVRLPVSERTRRAHEFHSLRDFAAWMQRHAKNQSAAEILVNGQGARALLDANDPTTDLVTCNLVPHPSFSAWLGALKSSLSQKAFHQHVRAHRATLPQDGIELLTALAQLKVAEGTGFESRIDERGFFAFSGGERTRTVSGKLPAEITVSVPIFEDVYRPDGFDLHRYALELLVSIEIEDGEASFTLACPQLPLVMREALKDAVAFLQRELGGDFLVGMGALMGSSVEDFRG